jgi:hypothetical protein
LLRLALSTFFSAWRAGFLSLKRCIHKSFSKREKKTTILSSQESDRVASSMSSLSHALDMSQTDLEQSGHANWQCSSISFKHLTWMVWPQGRTETSFVDSNKYWHSWNRINNRIVSEQEQRLNNSPKT